MTCIRTFPIMLYSSEAASRGRDNAQSRRAMGMELSVKTRRLLPSHRVYINSVLLAWVYIHLLAQEYCGTYCGAQFAPHTVADKVLILNVGRCLPLLPSKLYRSDSVATCPW